MIKKLSIDICVHVLVALFSVNAFAQESFNQPNGIIVLMDSVSVPLSSVSFEGELNKNRFSLKLSSNKKKAKLIFHYKGKKWRLASDASLLPVNIDLHRVNVNLFSDENRDALLLSFYYGPSMGKCNQTINGVYRSWVSLTLWENGRVDREGHRITEDCKIEKHQTFGKMSG